MKRPRWRATLAAGHGQNRSLSLRGDKFVVHFVHRVAHGADLSELTVKQLERRQQSITCQRHHAEVRKNVGEIAASHCEQQHSQHKTAESEWFDEIARAVGEDWNSSKHLGNHRGMTGKALEEMFFRAMDLYRFDPAEHLVRFAI